MSETKEVIPVSEEVTLLLTKHNKELESHEQTLEAHEIELKVQAEQIKALQDNTIKLENVVMSENRETRQTITETNKQLHELINGLMGYNSGKNQLQNNLAIAKWESIAKIVGMLAGSGGILFYIFN